MWPLGRSPCMASAAIKPHPQAEWVQPLGRLLDLLVHLFHLVQSQMMEDLISYSFYVDTSNGMKIKVTLEIKKFAL